jgi:hypothetical protein
MKICSREDRKRRHLQSSSPLCPEAVVENEEKGNGEMDGKTGLERGNGKGLEKWTGRKGLKREIERDWKTGWG